MAKKHEWSASDSLNTIDLKPRPVLDDISILIPTLGRPILEQCLYWILAGSAWPACLIVVEQGANQDVANWLNHAQDIGLKVKHILSDQSGRSAGINRGLEQVDTHFVAITDDDCFVADDWLMNMVSRLRLNPMDVITGRIEAAGEDIVMVVTAATSSIQKRPRINFDIMSGGNMATSLAVIQRVGLFDEDPVMATAEDAEWAYRALRQGFSLYYEPDVVVSHFGWRDVESRDGQYRHYALSHGGFYGKYLRRGDFFILVRSITHFLRAARRWLRGKLSGDGELALLGRSYCLNLLPGILAGVQSKRLPGKLK